ncbi:hypothetical protein Daura_04195 [Dactylosporangium aurantiacum]|uniref:Uncharacterized protein n=1 Tax=Dactylosporangium aurantiacum TaxID=35754 RepID=A0A9Q9MGD3_9ACTN|nr:hypothetical protein [Dactylosporangium aurantiacum]MDG6109424.1 hypothetical protein [Dactylosporangium aurantiacum]UWZ55449.1 hypothetical protein Daura_04195 [Dactylosporangium aurantiacum]
MSEEAAWWRGQAAGIPPKAADAFPLWPTTSTTTVRAPSTEPPRDRATPSSGAPGPGSDLVPAGLDPGLVDREARDAGAAAVLEHLQLAAARLERTAAELSAAELSAAELSAAAPSGMRLAEAERAEVEWTEAERAEAQRAEAELPEARRSVARLSGARPAEAPLSAAGELWPPAAMRVMRQPRDASRTSPPPGRRPRRPRTLRNPAAGLPAMLVIALLTGFFAWTSAEPFWLDLGQGEHGHAQVTRCTGDGVLRRCYATFRSESGATVTAVPLVGADDAPGTTLDARMRPGGRIAYAGNPSGLRVRWTVGFALVLLCGAALCWATGAGRLGRFRTRLAAYVLTAAAPIVLGLGVLVATY